MSSIVRLAIAGATGRTGRCVLEAAARDGRFEIAAALTSPGCSLSGTSVAAGSADVLITETLDAPCDVLVDFTVADGTMAWLEVCRSRDLAIVTGVTGHTEDQLARIHHAAGEIPILRASNFSVGIQTIMNIVGQVARALGEGYDVEIVETHHRHKVDAPSGTALALADEIAAATGRSRSDHAVYGRPGSTGERPARQIGIHAVRMGDQAGQHEIHFSGPGETVTIRHTAHSRDTFASGALRAAAWIVGKPAGLYSMRDVMGSAGG